MLNLSFCRLRARFTLLAVVALSALLLRSVAFAQTSVSNGSISGTVTDTTGAVVPNAKVTIAGPTGQTVRANTSDAGTYSSGALIPGCPPCFDLLNSSSNRSTKGTQLESESS